MRKKTLTTHIKIFYLFSARIGFAAQIGLGRPLFDTSIIPEVIILATSAFSFKLIA